MHGDKRGWRELIEFLLRISVSFIAFLSVRTGHYTDVNFSSNVAQRKFIEIFNPGIFFIVLDKENLNRCFSVLSRSIKKSMTALYRDSIALFLLIKHHYMSAESFSH